MRKEPFKPARCRSGLEKEIKVGLKTMVKRKKSGKKREEGEDRKNREGEKSKEGEIMNEK